MNGEQLTLEDVLGLAIATSRFFHEDRDDDEPAPNTFGSAERTGVCFVLWSIWSTAPAPWRVAIGQCFADLGPEWSEALDAALSAGRRLQYERAWEAREAA